MAGRPLIGGGWEDDDADGNNTEIESGSVYLFEQNSNGNWMQVQKITANDRFREDHLVIAYPLAMAISWLVS